MSFENPTILPNPENKETINLPKEPSKFKKLKKWRKKALP